MAKRVLSVYYPGKGSGIRRPAQQANTRRRMLGSSRGSVWSSSSAKDVGRRRGDSESKAASRGPAVATNQSRGPGRGRASWAESRDVWVQAQADRAMKKKKEQVVRACEKRFVESNLFLGARTSGCQSAMGNGQWEVMQTNNCNNIWGLLPDWATAVEAVAEGLELDLEHQTHQTPDATDRQTDRLARYYIIHVMAERLQSTGVKLPLMPANKQTHGAPSTKAPPQRHFEHEIRVSCLGASRQCNFVWVDNSMDARDTCVFGRTCRNHKLWLDCN